MKKVISLFFYLIVFNPIDISPQSMDDKFDGIGKSSGNIQVITNTNQNWELLLNSSLEQFTGGVQYAGAVFIPYYNEFWISQFGSDKILILSFYHDSLSLYDEITIEGGSNIRGMTFDGTYIYAANATDSISIIDPVFMDIVGYITAPQIARYVTFDPLADDNNGGLWIGNFSTDPTLIDWNGNIISSIPYAYLGKTTIYGAAFDYYSSGAPFLWLWSQNYGQGSPQVIFQVDPSTGMPTGLEYDVRTDPVIGEDSCLAGGLFITNELFPGKVVLGGVLQTSPDLLLGYDITTGSPPAVSTIPATNMTSNSVTLNGIVNPNDLITSVYFEYGISTNYDQYIEADQGLISGTSDINVSAAVNNLQPNTQYHFRVRAAGGAFINYGSDMTFTTASTNSGLITVTKNASNVTTNSATLNGTVNPDNLSTVVTFEYGPTTSYGNEISAVPSPVDGNLVVDVSAEITSLLPNKTYHYRIKGINSSETSFGADVAFTTSLEIIAAPFVVTDSATNINENSATLNGAVNPNNSSTTVIFEYGTTTSYGDQITALQSPVDGNSNFNVSAGINGLQSSTLYHYRVVGNNEAGTSNGSDITFTTLASTVKPLASTSNATNITSNSVILNGEVNPNNLITTIVFQYGISIAYGSEVTAAQSPINGGSGNINVSATVSGLQSNTSYHFRIQAAGGGSIVNGSDQMFTTSVDYPSYIKRINTFDFNDLTTNSYRMIGLPGNQNNTIHDMISGDHKIDWNIFFDNGNNSEYLTEFDNTSTFNFSPGKGFWVLSKNSFSINDSAESVTLSGENTFDIDLHTSTGGISVYRIISNPFEKNVSWASVQSINNLSTSDYLFNWDGKWSHASQMEPYKAYYFINANNLSSLKIPYSFSAAKIPGNNSVKTEKYGGKYIKLSLFQNVNERSYVIAGFNSSAINDYDKFDSFAPPGYFDEIRIHIEEEHLTFPYKQLFVSYRPEINDGQIFDLRIKNVSKKNIDLVTDGFDNFAWNQVYLLDESLSRFYNLKDKRRINISSIHSTGSYKLIIGNENFINNIKKDYVPRQYLLYQNYPNPFNSSTIIKYQIPYDNTIVELKVYNILGKEIMTLVNEKQETGIYEVGFNSSYLSSGIYFYTVNAGSYSETKKMIILK
ncbi:MAG: T9SS type A sorting domain-containing protein [Ignavibacteriaceae bacterium]